MKSTNYKFNEYYHNFKRKINNNKTSIIRNSVIFVFLSTTVFCMWTNFGGIVFSMALEALGAMTVLNAALGLIILAPIFLTTAYALIYSKKNKEAQLENDEVLVRDSYSDEDENAGKSTAITWAVAEGIAVAASIGTLGTICITNNLWQVLPVFAVAGQTIAQEFQLFMETGMVRHFIGVALPTLEIAILAAIFIGATYVIVKDLYCNLCSQEKHGILQFRNV